MSKPVKNRKRYSIVINTGLELKLQANHVKLYTPELNEIVPILKAGLSKNFEEVHVEIVDCPDLTEWCGLADKGLNGHCRLADVGGVPYLMDPHYHHITFQMPDVIKACGLEEAFVIGPSAASKNIVGKNAELISNVRLPGSNHSRYATIVEPNERLASPIIVKDKYYQYPENVNDTHQHEHEHQGHDEKEKDKDKDKDKKDVNKDNIIPHVGIYPSQELGCLANLFLCDGLPGKVLYIKAKKRTGDTNFTNCIRESLKNVKTINDDYINNDDDNNNKENKNITKQIGFGGVIKIKHGQIYAHIMPDFNSCKMDENNKKEINDWLKFFNMGPDLLMLSTGITDDPTKDKHLHLRLEHTHFYSYNKQKIHEGGHYHHDITPDIIEYEGYFNLAEYIYRIEDAYYNTTQKS